MKHIFSEHILYRLINQIVMFTNLIIRFIIQFTLFYSIAQHNKLKGHPCQLLTGSRYEAKTSAEIESEIVAI